MCVHATGPYLAYAEGLAKSISANWVGVGELRFVVFTDRVREVDWILGPSVKTLAIPVRGRQWPDSSMRRFEDYVLHADDLTADVLVFLDADMLVMAPPEDSLRDALHHEGITCVAHPGFYRPSVPARIGLLGRPVGARERGSWENRPESLAYVPAEDQDVYVCGGVWLGGRREALALCAELAVRIELDSLSGITAVWHDESHLNWWVAHHEAQVLTPEYCFVPGYPQIQGLTPRIVALDKPATLVDLIKG